MAAPWSRPAQPDGFSQNNIPAPFQGSQTYSVRPNNLQEGMSRQARPFSPVRNSVPRHFQEYRHTSPQTQELRNRPPPTQEFRHGPTQAQTYRHIPPQNKQYRHGLAQTQNFQRGSAPTGNFQPPHQAHSMMPPVSQFHRQQGMQSLNAESIGHQFNNQGPQNMPLSQQCRSEPKFQAFDNGQTFLKNTDRYQGLLKNDPVYPALSNPQHQQQAEFLADCNAQQGFSNSIMRSNLQQEDSDRKSAEAWVKNWLRQRKKSEKGKELKQPLTICEAQEKTRQMIVLLAKLQKHKQQLESMQKEEKIIWEQKLREVMKIKSEFEVLHQTLTSEETVAELGKKIRQRQSKRRRLKRLRQEKYDRGQEELARREQKHQEMDRLMEQVKQRHEHQKQEEAMKKEGDQILGEVKKKIAESTKSIQLLESLQKLRKLRVDRFERQGVLGRIEGFGVGSSSHKQKFEETVTGMTSLLNNQLHTYKAEEAALKVILETEQEETREKEREKLVQKQKEQRLTELRIEGQQLFGSQKEARPGDPLYPFAQYYKAAETSLEALISIRNRDNNFGYRMAANQGNVDVITDVGDIEVPSCAHGPALLFTRYDQATRSERKFFACSAFRDRKVCPFFQWADEKKIKSNFNCELEWPTFSHKKMRKRYSNFNKMKKKERQMCVDCGLLLLPGETEEHEGYGHQIKSKITKKLFARPTNLFCPLDSNKTYAQYLFSEKTVEFVLSSLQKLGTTHVLAVGCPRIHEAIQVEKKKTESSHDLESLLLDLDHRYIYPQSLFCRYNMLNHFFFGDVEDKKTFGEFIKETPGKRVAMVIDPPFGIMVEALSSTLKKIQDQFKASSEGAVADMPVLWFFPYFMERRVLDTNQGYAMLDYKVDYDNHSLFKGDSRKKGSPVRIFTNLPSKQIALPETEGYWYCDKCERYSAEENKHCDACNCCPTKDGYTYKHCDKCGRCVKPSRVHCNTCGMCDLPQHVCGQVHRTGCHICGEEGHKRRECPQRSQEPLRAQKRKGSKQQNNRAKKKKN